MVLTHLVIFSFFDGAGGATPAPVVQSATSTLGHGHPQPQFWWELSTISFLTRSAIRKRRATPDTPPPEIPAAVPDIAAAPALPESSFESEAQAAIFAANAEVGRLEAERVKASAEDDTRISELSSRIDAIKKELERISEEQDVLFIARLD